MKITNKIHIEQTAVLWESIGLGDQAAHIRLHGISLASGRVPKSTTTEKLERGARAWIYYGDLRVNGVAKPAAIKQCAERFGFTESKMTNIVKGSVPGVSEIKEQIQRNELETP